MAPIRVSSQELWKKTRREDVERAIIKMEQNGFALDVEFCRKAAERAGLEEADCLLRLDDWLAQVGQQGMEINWASSTQLTKLFHETLGFPPSPVWKKGRVRIDQGDRKLDETAIDWIMGKIPQHLRWGLGELVRLRRIRGAIKYLTKLPDYVASDGLVHPVSGPASDDDSRAGTITWRLASKNPEVMQIPTDPKKDWFRVRKAFIAPPGYTLLVADEKALEVVILAHLLIRLFDDHQLAEMVAPGAPDIHAVNARLVFGKYLGWSRHGRPVADFPLECFKSDEFPELQQLRQDIKAVWYGLMYGKGAFGFATSLRDPEGNGIGEEAAERIISALFEAVPGVPRYQKFVADYVKRHHGIIGLGGAWCDLSELTKSGDKWDLARAVRIGQNYPMQEGGARIIGQAMLDIMDDEKLTAQGLLIERQVHDELDFRLPLTSHRESVKEGINYHMTRFPLESQLQVAIGEGQTWDDC